MARCFGVRMQQLHNDSTSISLCGQYCGASGRSVRHQRALAITYGYSRDHRPDLKHLLFILTTDADGGVPVHFRCAAGNTTDVRTHIETWNRCQRSAYSGQFRVGVFPATWRPAR